MELVAERGLPVAPGEPGSGAPPQLAPSGKKTAANQAAKK
jgi:hypothetical protein